MPSVCSAINVANDELHQLFSKPTVIKEVGPTDGSFESESIDRTLNYKGCDLDVQSPHLLGVALDDCTDEVSKGQLKLR